MERYRIGDVNFIWKEGNYPLKQDDFMKKFLVDQLSDTNQKDEILYETCYEGLEKYTKGTLLEKNGLYELYQLPGGKFIIYHWATCRFAFGYWLENLEKSNVVSYYFNPKLKKEIPLDAVRFFSCAGMHSKLLEKRALVFHSSYIAWNDKAILFAGSSGVGKSTQAKLWERYAKAQIINGDRTLIRKKDNLWMAYGYPCCGSSSICMNQTLPISAIVILEQGIKNEIEVLEDREKIRAILTGSEIYRWNMREIERVCDIAEELIKEIRIVKLICRKDEDAILTLKRWMEEN